MDFNFCTHIHSIYRDRSHLKILEKCGRGRSQALPKILWHPYIRRIARSFLRLLSFVDEFCS